MSNQLVFPVERRAIGLAREAVAGTPVAPTVTVPMNKFSPEDKVNGLIDESWRQAMAGEYGYTQGTYSSDLDMGGPIYADTIGHFLLNTLGDYTVTGTATGPNTTLTGTANTAGATALTVAAGTSFTQGMWIQVGSGSTAEIVQVSGAGGSTSIPIASTPLRFSHAAAETVTNTAGPYTHVFSLLNSEAGGAQPPTHTMADITGMAASTGARLYSSTCLSELTITGNPANFLEWEGKGTGFLSGIAAVKPTVAPSSVPAQAAWNSKTGIGGPASGATLNNYVGEWGLTLTRKVTPYWTASGQQNPYVIARGALTTSLDLKFEPIPDESQLLNFLNATKPAVQLIATGPNGSTLQIDAQVAAFDTGKLQDGSDAFGFDVTAKAIANTTNVGASGGYSPVKITLTNSFPSY